MSRRFPAFVLLLAVPLSAQSVTVSIATLTAVDVHGSTVGVGGQTFTVPAATMGAQFVTAGTAFATATTGWTAHADDATVTVSWDLSALVSFSNLTPSHVWVGPGDLVATLHATTPTPVLIDISRVFASSSGAPMPPHLVDVGNDGVVDFNELSFGPGTTSRVLGPTALPIVLRGAVGLDQDGAVLLSLRITVRPDNALQVNGIAPGCSSTAGLAVEPAFVGRGLRFSNFQPDPMVVVLGVSPAPFAAFGASGSPCWWMPSLDILTFVPSGQSFLQPLPAAVRPVTVWAQAVLLTPAGLTPTDSFAIPAW